MLVPELNDKQKNILSVANKLFAENGYEGTSIRDIAKEAKINIAMISYYFGSKERLLESLIIQRVSGLKPLLEALVIENISPLDKIDKLIDIYTEKIIFNKGVFRTLHMENSCQKGQERFKIFNDIKKANLECIEKIVLEGQEKGVFSKSITIPLITPTMLGTFFYFSINKDFYFDLFSLKDEKAYNEYIETNLTPHIKRTIKAILLYEN